MTKKRHPSQHSKATNDPLALTSVNLNNHSGGRRYRDLVLYYQERLGAEAFNKEDIRIKALSLIALTLELERALDGSIKGDGTSGKLIKSFGYDRNGQPTKFIYSQSDPYLIGHLTGQIATLVKSLGLETKVVPSKVVAPVSLNHNENGNGSAAPLKTPLFDEMILK